MVDQWRLMFFCGFETDVLFSCDIPPLSRIHKCLFRVVTFPALSTC